MKPVNRSLSAILVTLCLYGISGCVTNERQDTTPCPRPTPTESPTAPTHVPIVATAGTFQPTGSSHGVAFTFPLPSGIAESRIVISYQKLTIGAGSGSTGGGAGGSTGGSAGGATATLSALLGPVNGNRTHTTSGPITTYTQNQPIAQINANDVIVVTIMAFDPSLPEYRVGVNILTAQ